MSDATIQLRAMGPLLMQQVDAELARDPGRFDFLRWLDEEDEREAEKRRATKAADHLVACIERMAARPEIIATLRAALDRVEVSGG